MKGPVGATERLLSRAGKDSEFRARLLANPKEALEREFGLTLAEVHEVHVHEETDHATHLVIPPESRFSEEEREVARTGAASLEFLKKTMYDPAPPARQPTSQSASARSSTRTSGAVTRAAKDSIRRALDFLASAIDENGAWHCVRFNVADPEIPRHFERPPFISAFCVLALESCEEPQAKSICTATRKYLVDTMEYPGFWRYYRHLPQDLDSTTLCSLVLASDPTHPWILLGRNVPRMLANRDTDGRFRTWMLAEGEPDVVSRFRIEADPVVNANVIAYLGDHAETRDAQDWLAALIAEDNLEGRSKWYPDTVAVYYAITRAMIRAYPVLDQQRPILADRILDLRDKQGDFGNILKTAQAVSALYNIGSLERIDAKREVERFVDSQHQDGSWPELLAFGDQSLKFGVVGQFAHGSESVTSAFCIEALARLLEMLED